MTSGTPSPPTDRRFASALASLSRAQKSSRGAPAYSRFVNRPLGRLIAAAAFTLRLTPNQITGVSAVLTFTGIVLIAAVPPTVVSSLAVVAALVLGYAFDAADGQLARLRGGGSLAGEWLDHVVDAIKSSSIHAAVLIAWFRFFDPPQPMLLIPLGFQLVTAVFFFAMILTDQLRRLNRGSAAPAVKSTGSTSPLYAIAVIPADYGLLCLLFALLWWQPVFLVLYSLLLVANAGILAASLVRWFSEMRRLA